MNVKQWNTAAQNHAARIARAASLAQGKRVDASRTTDLMEAVIEPGDRVCLEGNNQKQADFLAECLARCVAGTRSRSAHRAVRARASEPHGALRAGLAKKVDFSFSGPQGARLAKLVSGRARSRSARSTPI